MEGEQTGGGGRGRKRLNSGALARLAVKMPKCYVSVENINVEEQQAKLRACMRDSQGDDKGSLGDDLEQVNSEKLSCNDRGDDLTAAIFGDKDLELEVCSDAADEEDVNSNINKDTINVCEEDSETHTRNTDVVVRETRASRQRVNLVGSTILKQGDNNEAESDEAPSVPTRRAPSSRIVGMKAAAVPGDTAAPASPVKFVSVKTGRVFEKHPCQQCEKVFASSMGLQLHLSSHMLECKVCSLSFPTSHLLKTHTEQHITSMGGSLQLQCKVCSKEFSAQKHLKKHNQQLDVHKRPFSCSLDTCERTFTRLAQLANHRHFHPDPRHLQCAKCAMRFSSQSCLSIHQKLLNCGKQMKIPTQGCVKQFQCTDCPKSFSSSDYLEMHKYYHWDTIYRALACKVESCMQSFSSKYQLERHMEEHTDLVKDGMMVCSVIKCDERFKDPRLLKEHLENHRKVEMCRGCGLHFDSKLDMLLHRVICVEEKRVKEKFACQVCSKTLKANRFLNNHVSLCGRRELIKCDICAGEFESKQNLKDHVSISHAKLPPVAVKEITKPSVPSVVIRCDEPGCDKPFTRYILLKNHLYSHTDNPYHCTQECQSSFSQLENYKEHCRTEHGGKFSFLRCDKCEQVFTVESHLENHTDKFHEKSIDLAIFDDAQFYDVESSVGSPFLCKHTDCGAQFSLRSQLRTHYATHDPLAHPCSECDSVFDNRTSLTQHIVSEHQVASPPVFCPFCEDSFLSAQYLRIHLLSVHPPPWSCSQPGCSFFPTYLLEASIHMQTHQVKNCDWPGCEQSFLARDVLMEHVQKHTQTLLSCPVQTCSFICCMTDVFEAHLEQHRDEMVFSCHPCTYHSYNMRQLECHLESGHRQRPKPHEFTSEVNLSCKVLGCSASFVQENWLMKHIRTVHGKVETEKVPPLVFLSSKDTTAIIESVEIVTDNDACEVESAGDDCNEVVEHLNVKDKSIEEQAVISTLVEIEVPKDVDTLNEKDSEVSTAPNSPTPTTPKLDNTLVSPYTAGTSPGPPLASSPLRVDQQQTDDSVIIVEISDEVFTEPSSDTNDIVPPVKRKNVEDKENEKDLTAFLDEENNVCSEVELSKDVIIEEVAEDSVDSEKDLTEEHSVDNVECFDSLVVVNTNFVDEDVVEHLISVDSSVCHDDIAVSDKSKENTTDDGEVVKNEPCESEDNRKSALHALYSSVVTDTTTCPLSGQFTSLLAINQNMLGNTVVPDLLEPVDESSLCKGLAIDLLEMQQQSGVSQELLASFVSQLLPRGVRPALLEPGMVQQMVNRLSKMKVQATRFRAKYRNFPMYLNRYLVELCNPFM